MIAVEYVLYSLNVCLFFIILRGSNELILKYFMHKLSKYFQPSLTLFSYFSVMQFELADCSQTLALQTLTGENTRVHGAQTPALRQWAGVPSTVTT